ncbi:hypothetical protein [Burkholderia ubonensis]|uniref:hypothetical protein n=1 Tax=Burkholderia ubonensis TaxID=101571 RepID=UPI001055D496|nr:hypothetical protein [Burkholderia ubonensis]
MQPAFEPDQPMPPEAENEIGTKKDHLDRVGTMTECAEVGVSIRTSMLRAPGNQMFTLFNDVDKEYRCFSSGIDFFTLLLLSYCAKSCWYNGIASFRSTGWG